MATIEIKLNESNGENTLHHLPCSLNYDGFCKVSSYFVPKLKKGENGEFMEASFRGRELSGFVHTLPTGVSGVILRELVGAELDANSVVKNSVDASEAERNFEESSSEGGFFGDLENCDEGESQEDNKCVKHVGGASRMWAVDGRFTKITAWLHDTPATDHELVPRALQWMQLAQKIHSF